MTETITREYHAIYRKGIKQSEHIDFRKALSVARHLAMSTKQPILIAREVLVISHVMTVQPEPKT